MTDFDDDELERRMRERLFGAGNSKPVKPVLNEHDQKVAAKLMGATNAQRLANPNRPFRYRPPVVIAEFYELPGGFWSGGGWRIDVIEDGQRREHRHGMSQADCMKELRILTDKGATARKIETEWMKREAEERRAARHAPKTGQKAAILDQLKGFRL